MLKSVSVERALDIWESEGGALASPAKVTLTGTANQIAWAEQIRASVNAEFDRVASALQARLGSQTERRRADTLAMIVILEKKRAEVTLPVILMKDFPSYRKIPSNEAVQMLPFLSCMTFRVIHLGP